MTTNKPEVAAYHRINKESPEIKGVILRRDASCTSTWNDTEPLVCLSAYEALQAECEKLRKDAERYVPLHEAVQRAAAELPEGWEIQLCVMRDSGWVDLIGPDGTEDFHTDKERLDYTVIDALAFAIDAAMQRAKP